MEIPYRYGLSIRKLNEDGKSYHFISFRICRTAREALLRAKPVVEKLIPGESVCIEIRASDRTR